jgi:hypothetical protein
LQLLTSLELYTGVLPAADVLAIADIFVVAIVFDVDAFQSFLLRCYFHAVGGVLRLRASLLRLRLVCRCHI